MTDTPTIQKVRLSTVNTPRREGPVCGHVIVEVDTDVGITGLGEMSDLQHLPRFHFDIPELERTLDEILVGRPVWQINATTQLMEANYPESLYVRDKSRVIKCGVDLALWDILGKATGRRVAELLGGPVRESLEIAYPLFRVREPDDIDQRLATVQRLLDDGFNMFRVYVGVRPHLDAELLRRLQADFGDRIQIKSIDFSNLVSWKDAVAFVDDVGADVSFDLVESPSRHGDIEGLARATDAMRHPVSEHVYASRWLIDLISRRAVDVMNVSVIAAGGISQARRALLAAEAAGIPCLIGTTQELSIGTSAAAHLGCAMPIVTHASDPVGPLLYTKDVVVDPVRFEKGRLHLPSGPGLGMELDPDRLADAAGPLTWSTSEVEDPNRRTGR